VATWRRWILPVAVRGRLDAIKTLAGILKAASLGFKNSITSSCVTVLPSLAVNMCTRANNRDVSVIQARYYQ
jgi:uncharacterized ion transporter superfamily protein YfcC